MEPYISSTAADMAVERADDEAGLKAAAEAKREARTAADFIMAMVE